MRRNDDATALEATGSDDTAITRDTSSAPTRSLEVAKACYELALAVLDGDQDRARALARALLGAAIERAAGQG